MTTGMYFIIPTLLVIFLSLLIVRAAAVALALTGLDRRRAWFQALSAFTGTGFTTREAEAVVNHQSRRRIISALMLLGNAGIVTVIIAATSTIFKSEGLHLPVSIVLLFLGVYLIYKIGTYKKFNNKWDKFIRSHLVRYLSIEGNIIEEQFDVSFDFGVVKVSVVPGSPLLDKTISESALTGADLLVLGIERGKSWISHPKPNEVIRCQDMLVVYGPMDFLKEKFRSPGRPSNAVTGIEQQ